MSMLAMPSSSVVAYLGPQGTFSHAAAGAFFGGAVSGQRWDMLSCSSIEDVFASVARSESRYGVVPVENSTEGAVNNTQDCLLDAAVSVVGEIVLPIRHNLLAAPGTSLDQLRSIVSHKQSLAQCRRWLASNVPSLPREECASNAQAATMAASQPGVGAIAGEFAARTYGLTILASSIQDHSHNSTRFLILSQPGAAAPATSSTSGLGVKTSLLVATDNKPGALFRILAPFNAQSVDLSKIEARPSKRRAWEYVFFIDFVLPNACPGRADAHGEEIDSLLQALREEASSVRVLGSYALAVGAEGAAGADEGTDARGGDV